MIDTSTNMLYHIGNLNTKNESISRQMATGKVIDKEQADILREVDKLLGLKKGGMMKKMGYMYGGSAMKKSKTGYGKGGMTKSKKK